MIERGTTQRVLKIYLLVAPPSSLRRSPSSVSLSWLASSPPLVYPPPPLLSPPPLSPPSLSPPLSPERKEKKRAEEAGEEEKE